MRVFKTMLMLLIISFTFAACDRDPINANKRLGDKNSKMPKWPTKEELLKESSKIKTPNTSPIEKNEK